MRVWPGQGLGACCCSGLDACLCYYLSTFFQAVEQLLVSGQPLLIFLEEPPGTQGPRLSALGQAWLGLVVQAIQVGVVPDAMLVPVAITYDLVPDAPCDTIHVRPSYPLGSHVDTISRKGAQYCVLWPRAPQV